MKKRHLTFFILFAIFTTHYHCKIHTWNSTNWNLLYEGQFRGYWSYHMPFIILMSSYITEGGYGTPQASGSRCDVTFAHPYTHLDLTFASTVIGKFNLHNYFNVWLFFFYVFRYQVNVDQVPLLAAQNGMSLILVVVKVVS